ncbi:6796_t:CDS:10 [Acaulospora morrowiae]|uniref:6796_t:CDS:1 n=1 Tax=Acaulospora morrowiae TaxID=94023 RepID=A0A9N8W6E3_9GLOM|nr:6796_t:CDS:10 [Acaulospora morrowiae]
MTAKSIKKNGGSALKRLKTTLKEAGIIGPNSRSGISKKQKRKGEPKEIGKNNIKSKIGHINGKVNPFELKVTRTKHNVLGKKVKGVQGRPGLKRQIGVEKRKKTLLVEMESKNKVGGVVDRRFGENNPDMPPEEKMLERFTREKQRQSKSSLFNLEDEEDLTHYGQSLSLIDDFDEPNLAPSDEEEDKGMIDQDIESERKKSKAEVMKEVIAKSKMYKYERQFEKDEDNRVRNELDNELNEIRDLLIVPPNPRTESTESASKRLVSDKEKSEKNDKDDEYDRIVRELVFEKRGRPTDRTKTEEEIALEEKEKLEKLEDTNDYSSVASSKKTSKLPRKLGTTKVEGKELAYVFPCPESLGELLEILKDIDDENIPTVMHRIRVLHNVKLSADNQEKLEKFFQALIDYILNRVAQENPIPMVLINKLVVHVFDLANQFPETARNYFITEISLMQNSFMKKLGSPNNKSFNSFLPTISELVLLRILSLVFPTSDFHHAVVTPATLLMGQYLAQCPLLFGRDLIAAIQHHHLLFLMISTRKFQTLSQRIYPEVLNFLNTALAYLAPKGTFTSAKSIPGTFPISEKIETDIQIEDASNIKDVRPLDFSRLLGQTTTKNNDIFNRDEFRISALSSILHLVEKYAKLYSSTAAFIELFDATYKILLLYPIDKFSKVIKTKLADVLGKLERLRKFAKQSRKPLELQHHRPIPLPTYIPKFREKFSVDKHYDPDRERAKLNKLKSQYKKERKGAIRELRKDSQFVARHNVDKAKARDAVYKKKINSIMGILETEQGEKKAHEKAKKYGKL